MDYRRRRATDHERRDAYGEPPRLGELFSILNGGTYNHNVVSASPFGLQGDIPGSGSRVFDASSTVVIQKWGNFGNPLVPLPSVAWGHLTIAVTNLGTNWDQSGQLQTVNGNLSIQNTSGGFDFVLSNTSSYTMNIGGNLQVSGGRFNLSFGSSGTKVVNLGGNLSQSGPGLIYASAPSATVNFTGGPSLVTYSSSTGNVSTTNLNWGIAAGKTVQFNNPFTNSAGRTFNINLGGILLARSLIANSGLFSVNGEFRLGDGGAASGGPAFSYSATGTLSFASTGSFNVSGANGAFTYWSPNPPNPPQNITVLGGGVTLSFPPRTVGGLFQYAAGVTNAHVLILNGTSQVNTGGFIVSGSPIYGGSSTLRYNTGGTYGRNGEWLPNVTSGAGYPANVFVFGTNLDLPNGSAGSFFQMAGNLSIEGTSTLNLNGTPTMTQPLTVLGNITNDGTLTLSTSSGGGLTVHGNFTNNATGIFNANASNLTFSGGNSQTWSDASGAQNFGAVVINKTSGVVSVSGTVNVSSLTVTAGALGGTGTVVGPINVGSGGTVAPGTSPGILNTGNISFTSGSTFDVEINGTTPGTGHDQLNVTGTVSLGGATLNLSGSHTPAAGNTFTIVNNDNIDLITGNFTMGTGGTDSNGGTLAQGDTISNFLGSGLNATISYINGLNDVVLTVQAPGPGTYVWTPAVLATDFQVPTNWNPTRVLPDPGDVLIFDGDVTLAPIVENVPTQTIAAMRLQDANIAVTMRTSGSNTLTISGATGTDLSVPSGTSLTVDGLNALRLSLTSATPSSIGGQIILQGGAHRLLSANAGQVQFLSGAIFTTATGLSGNPFGTGNAGDGVNFGIAFQNGSSYFHNAGNSPFGDASHGVASFQTGSLATFLTASGFEGSGRTYANLAIGKTDPGGIAVNASHTGSLDFQVDNLEINSPAASNSFLTFTGTGTSAIRVRGNITSNGGVGTIPDVTLTPGPTGLGIIIFKLAGGSLTFGNDGTNGHAINLDGSAQVNAGTTLTLNRPVQMGLTATNILSIQAAADLLHGDADGYVIGFERLNFSASAGTVTKTFPVGTVNGYSPVDVELSISSSGDYQQTVKAFQGQHPSISGTDALQRYWNITPVSGVAAATPNQLTLHYLAGDVVGTEGNYQFFKNNGGVFTQLTPDVLNTTSHFATKNGPFLFSDWTLADPAAVQEGTIQFFGLSVSNFEANGNIPFTVTRSGGSDGEVSVNYNLVDIGATGGATYTGSTDYINTSGTVTWAAGDATDKTINVTVCDDADFEGNENFRAELVTPTGGATVGSPSTIIGIIVNDDAAPDVSVAVSPSSVSEDGATNLVYTFTRTVGTTNALTVNFSASGIASSSTDYALTDATTFDGTNGTVTIAASNTTASVTVNPTTDATYETNETVILTVTSGGGYNVGPCRCNRHDHE